MIGIRRRPAVTVAKVCNAQGYVLAHPLPKLPHGGKVPDWSTCPGTLHQVYDTPETAERVARWWYGRRVRIAA